MNQEEVLKIIEQAARDGRTELSLSRGLTSLPAEIWELKNLTTLNLGSNNLSSLPAEIGQLKNLTVLWLYNNNLTSLPAEIGQLKNLIELYLYKNKLTSMPAEIGQLKNLRRLNLNRNQLTELPVEIAKLTNLKFFALGDNQLTMLPAEIWQLTNIENLYIWSHQWNTLSAEIGKLTKLKIINVSGNNLTSLPAEIGQLENLTELYLYKNKLTSVPAEIGQLKSLTTLNLDDNPLKEPPPEIVEQGTKAVLAYLRELSKDREAGKEPSKRYEAKLLVVGEAGVGKTELVKALLEEQFGEESATAGVLIRTLEVEHPKEAAVKMRLNLWDFGGQEIQHATHQFFYSERTLFLLVWNARENYEQAKLNDWLELIQARAWVQADSESGKAGWRVPVLLVATHCDLWRPDIPYHELQKQFSGIEFLGMVKVSNKPPRRGIEELLERLAVEAEKLPYMGMDWPEDWQRVEDMIGKRLEKKQSRMRADELWGLMDSAGVSTESREPLAKALDGMGKIKIFLDDDQLKDAVVLDPQWLTNRIARVLKNEDKNKKAICKYAILEKRHWKTFWPDEDEETHRLFVQMMRSFDLVYGLGDRPDEAWLVVQLLSYQLSERETTKRDEIWSSFEGYPEIGMKFRLDQTIPPGIPTWFIAREHRFSLELHWRLGVLLGDRPEEPRHVGLVQSFPEQRYVQVTVRGPMPHNFFVLLRDGLEFTLRRFPGLRIHRKVPCPEQVCEHEFDFGDLEGFVERGQNHSQCQKTGERIAVNKLLYGIHESTTEEISRQIESLQKEMIRDLGVVITEEIRTRDELKAEHREIIDSLDKLHEYSALLQRGFVTLFTAMQRLEESACPNVFVILPKGEKSWMQNVFGQKMQLQLYCHAPGHWHPTYKGGCYEIKEPPEWLKTMTPYILPLAKVIKYAAPLAGPAAGMASAAFAEKFEHQLKMMEELAEKLGDDRDIGAAELTEGIGKIGRLEQAEGAPLRALRELLDKADTKHDWGGLKKILTPEGHYLWLCEECAKEYKI
ncbi:MAG: leucine-rich repeat domain-containing protein [Planctomycetota bacterium]|jgi:Leucine-rich repeat (LRR) protein